jgi:hypothetical protein
MKSCNRIACGVAASGECRAAGDATWFDDAIPAPFDLPHAGAVIRVQLLAVLGRLPEVPCELAEEA